jgi:hypothetical protein
MGKAVPRLDGSCKLVAAKLLAADSIWYTMSSKEDAAVNIEPQISGTPWRRDDLERVKRLEIAECSGCDSDLNPLDSDTCWRGSGLWIGCKKACPRRADASVNATIVGKQSARKMFRRVSSSDDVGIAPILDMCTCGSRRFIRLISLWW